MATNQALLVSLPYDITDLLCSFLKVSEINELASTCKDLNENYFCYGVEKDCNNLVCAKSNANILYCSAETSPVIGIRGRARSLKLVKFTISTKDQGWVNESESGSWVEA